MNVDPVRLVMVDDSAHVRHLLEVAVQFDDRFELVGAATDPVGAVVMAALAQPDVALVDLDLGDADGVHVARRIRAVSPATQIVLWSARPSDDRDAAAAKVGAALSCSKSLGPYGMLDALAAMASPVRSAGSA